MRFTKALIRLMLLLAFMLVLSFDKVDKG